jgi:predicted lipoprotein with Yx(FWY)xxD motif
MHKMNTIQSVISGLLLALAGLSLSLTSAIAADAPAKKSGEILASDSGMTLYSFDKDTTGSGKSACNGPCTKLWPPLTASADAKNSGDFSVINRDDGTRQWAYKGKPLYLYSADQKAGDRNGDNFKDIWHVVKN